MMKQGPECSGLHPYGWTDRVRRVWRGILLIYLSERDREEILDVVRAELSFFEKLLVRGVTAGEFKIRKVPLLAHDIVMLGHGWATRRWFLRKETTLEEYIEEHIDLILDAIRVLPGETRVLEV